jgi:hypothetical protein
MRTLRIWSGAILLLALLGASEVPAIFRQPDELTVKTASLQERQRPE